ncbi:PAS domain S-box protein [Caldimonas tepidiphila]|uniref:PAS domain S-box protein n=1 Tax=Caldimonas tepidiphila TaxID=2315841 RepID=UPI000E5B65AA|nr:PAS domain S-box protein [Caldimonas tepidiphila]
MSALPSNPPPAAPSAAPRPRPLFGHWWRKQSPARQDRYATLGPLVSVLLFLAAIITAFWYLRTEEVEREQESVRRDTEVAQREIRLRLIENQEQLVRIAREITTRAIDQNAFTDQAERFVLERAEVVSLSWFDARGTRRVAYASPTHAFQFDREVAPAESPGTPATPLRGEPARAFGAARELRQPVYSRPYATAEGVDVIQVQVPLLDRNGFAGTVAAEYSVEGLLRHFVPKEVVKRHAMSLIDGNGKVLASTTSSAAENGRGPSLFHDVPIAPVGNGLMLRGQGWRTSIGLISNTLFWMVVSLSALTLWMLWGTWRHMRRRLQAQNALVAETNFRRAMENSVLTGMRAMDLEGRITYVNAAYCSMTGYSEAELIGRLPPFPHWSPDRMEETQRILQMELQGRSPPGGIEVRVRRKDGTEFDARMYVSPLIDAHGRQTGWMTSMTNITEAKRIRDQLSASHERFTTVLEGLDAAVSVLSVHQGELLFANRSYRLWFGADAQGHELLAGGVPSEGELPPGAEDSVDDLGGLPTQELMEAGSELREIYVDSLDKWFDVRARYLQWTDGRLAQMLIATDVTGRRRAEEQAAAQAEKAQVTSRLVTMGEMASSVAHELNQPLAAISNYCNGMISRVKNDAIEKEALITALEKTAKQAQRAGQIIHRIRSFVKRSEPQRQPSDAREIVEDAVELAMFELRRRNVSIHTYLAQRLPTLMVDPILIEQVLLNLLKNAAEAIDMAKMPSSRRNIELQVVPRHLDEEGDVIEFTVTDTGPGVKEEVLARLYEAFFSTKAEGLGIGLSLCRSIIESHHGRIRVENLYNGPQVVGCRFTFTLPVDVVHH